MKTALVLSGGSIKGAFQAGAIAEVLDSGFTPEGIYGTSVGSLNGGFLAERAGRAASRGEEPDWGAIGRELEAFWRQSVTSFRQIGRKRNLLELLFDVGLKDFDGLIDTTPLKGLVKDILKQDNLRNAPVHFSACSVNVANGEAVYATPQDSNILDYIIASTAIPVVMPITWVRSEPYVDGGIREVAPLNRAIDDGAEHIICIVCQPEKTGGVSFDLGDLMKLSERLMDIVTNELVNNDLKRFHEINAMVRESQGTRDENPLSGKRYIPMVCIRPDKTIDIDLEDFTPAEIDNALKMGRRAAREALENDSE